MGGATMPRDGVRAGKTEAERTVSKVMAALPAPSISGTEKICKVDRLEAVHEGYLPNARKVHDTISELINLCRFYVLLKSQTTGLGQETHYLAEMAALGQAMTELIGPEPRHQVVLRAKEILRGRDLAIQNHPSMSDAVAQDIRELGID